MARLVVLAVGGWSCDPRSPPISPPQRLAIEATVVTSRCAHPRRVARVPRVGCPRGRRRPTPNPRRNRNCSRIRNRPNRAPPTKTESAHRHLRSLFRVQPREEAPRPASPTRRWRSDREAALRAERERVERDRQVRLEQQKVAEQAAREAASRQEAQRGSRTSGRGATRRRREASRRTAPHGGRGPHPRGARKRAARADGRGRARDGRPGQRARSAMGRGDPGPDPARLDPSASARAGLDCTVPCLAGAGRRGGQRCASRRAMATKRCASRSKRRCIVHPHCRRRRTRRCSNATSRYGSDPMTRRSLLASCLLALVALLQLPRAHAQLRIEITSGVTDPMPIAVVPFARRRWRLRFRGRRAAGSRAQRPFPPAAARSMPSRPTRADGSRRRRLARARVPTTCSWVAPARRGAAR